MRCYARIRLGQINYKRFHVNPEIALNSVNSNNNNNIKINYIIYMIKRLV